MNQRTMIASGAGPEVAERFASWRRGKLLHSGRWFCGWQCQPQGLAGSSRYEYFLRTLQPNLSPVQRGEAAALFGNHILAYESIDHAGMIPIIDAELDCQPFFLVEPFVAGDTSDRWVQSWPEVCVSRLLWVIRQLGEIVSAAHDQRRAHLNLRPDNVLVDQQGRVSLTGWSLSTVVGQPLNSPGMQVVETNAFAAPETRLANYRVGLAADIFSLGCLMHFLFCGQRPVKGRDLRELQPEAPFRLSRLLQAMTADRPSERPDTKSVVDQLISIELDHLQNDLAVIWPEGICGT